MYIEDGYGTDSLDAVISSYKKEFETYYLNTEYDAPISINQPNRITYIKGPLIFHYVRQKIGDDN